MASVLHVSITPAMEKYIQAKTEGTGEYLNPNELVRAAILAMIRQDYDYKAPSGIFASGSLGENISND